MTINSAVSQRLWFSGKSSLSIVVTQLLLDSEKEKKIPTFISGLFTLLQFACWIQCPEYGTHIQTYPPACAGGLFNFSIQKCSAHNLSKVPFLCLEGELRKRVCKALVWNRIFLSTSVLDDICDQRDICCSSAASVLQNRL